MQEKVQETLQVYLESLGCAKNRVDSEIMAGTLATQGYGLTQDPANAQVIVVNTCAFLTSASQESINRLLELSEYKQTGVCRYLVCAGCLSERHREELLTEMPELDALVGSSNFHEISEVIAALQQKRSTPLVRLLPKPHYAHYEQRARQRSTQGGSVYLKVAEGCSNMCSFCNIPFLRGYFSSRRIQNVVEEATQWVQRGVRELNLISQDTSSYGVDLKDGSNLATLLRQLDRIEGDFWLRLFYAYPNPFNAEVMTAIAQSEHVLPYVDMPFQHIADPVLRDMNRRITKKRILSLLERMQHTIPNLALRSTLIVGFPTETQVQFEELLAFVEEGWFTHLGVFTYSHEDNIRAAAFGDPIPAREKQRRKQAILQAQQKISAKRNQAMVGKTTRALICGPHEETPLLLKARTAFQGPDVDGCTLINEGTANTGDFCNIHITEAHPYDLIAKIC